MTVTCPKYPAVPLSISGMSAARHILLTWFRAAIKKHQNLHQHSDNLVIILYNVNQRMHTFMIWHKGWYSSYYTHISQNILNLSHSRTDTNPKFSINVHDSHVDFCRFLTSVVQSIHNQCKLSEEINSIIWTTKQIMKMIRSFRSLSCSQEG